MVEITKHPPHALIKNKRINDKINVMNITARDIGHVCFKSDIDS